MYNEMIGLYLSHLRTKAEKTALQMSRALGINDEHYWLNIEAGKTSLTLCELERSAWLMNTTPSAFVSNMRILSTAMDKKGVTVSTVDLEAMEMKLLTGDELVDFITRCGVMEK
jgi:hypothetical protein